jgi:prepilin-type N-terminal cleavage/methylation domain-containing protein
MMSSRNHPSFLITSQAGFTLIELIIVMGIFIVAIMLSSDAFNRIASLSTQQIKSSESNIQGIVGLELMRADIEHAGYGLPWKMPFEANFEESQVAPNFLAKGINPAFFNDINNIGVEEDNKAPRAFQSAPASFATADPDEPASADPSTDGRDYLVVKSTAIGMSNATKKWSYVEGTGAGATLKVWGENDFVSGERVIVQKLPERELITVSGAAALAANVSDSGKTFSDILDGSPPKLSKNDFAPQQDSDVYLVYGVTPSSDLRVP